MAENNNHEIVTAAMIAIGDELLSGRTRDKNIGHLATALTLQGIDLKEVRIVSDDEVEIVQAVNALRKRYNYVFTSGGIGPTHDDITADAIAVAFGISIDHDPRAMKLLETYYNSREIEFTNARKRMARVPHNADLIDNPVSIAPGFVVDNVHVMAGVPSIFQAMLENVLPTLNGGAKMISDHVECKHGEGTIGDGLAEIQKAHMDTAIGSYPKFDGKAYTTQIVVRGRDEQQIANAVSDIQAMLDELEG